MSQIEFVLVLFLLFHSSEIVRGQQICENAILESNKIDVFQLSAKTESGLRDPANKNGSYFEIKAKVTLKNWKSCVFEIKIEVENVREKNMYSSSAEELYDGGPSKELFFEKTVFTMENGLVKNIFPAAELKKDENQGLMNFQRGIIGLFQITENKKDGLTEVLEDDVTGRCGVIYNQQKDQEGKWVISKQRNLNNCTMRYFSNSNFVAASESPLFNSSSMCLYTMKKEKGDGIDTIKCRELNSLVPLSDSNVGGYANTRLTLKRISSRPIKEKKPSTDGAPKTTLHYDHAYVKHKKAKNDYQLAYKAQRIIKKLSSEKYIRESEKHAPGLFLKAVKVLRQLTSPSIDKVFKSESTESEKRLMKDVLASCGSVYCITKLFKTLDKKTVGVRKYRMEPHVISGLAFTPYLDSNSLRLIENMYRKTNDPSTMLTLTTLISRYCKRMLNCEQSRGIIRYIEKLVERYLLRRREQCSISFNEEEKKEKLVVLKSIQNINYLISQSTRIEKTLIDCMFNSPHHEISNAAIEAFHGSIMPIESKERIKELFANSKEDLEKRVTAFRVLSFYFDKSFIKYAIKVANKRKEDPQLRMFISSFLNTKSRLSKTYSEILKKHPLKDVKESQDRNSHFMISKVASNITDGEIIEWTIYKQGGNFPIAISYTLNTKIFGAKVNVFEVSTRFHDKDSYNRHSGTGLTPKGIAFVKIYGCVIDTFSLDEFSKLDGNMFKQKNLFSILLTLGQGIRKTFKKQSIVFEGIHSIPTILGNSISISANILADLTLDMFGRIKLPNQLSGLKTFEFDGHFHPSVSLSASAQLITSIPKVTDVGTKLDVAFIATKKIEGNIKFKKGEELNLEYKLDKQRDFIFNISTNITQVSKMKSLQMNRTKMTATCTKEAWESSDLSGLNICYQQQYASPKRSFSYNFLAAPLSVALLCTSDDKKLVSYTIWADLAGSNKVAITPTGSPLKRYQLLDFSTKSKNNTAKQTGFTHMLISSADGYPKAYIYATSKTTAFYKQQNEHSTGEIIFHFKNFKYNEEWIFNSSQRCFEYVSKVRFTGNGSYLEHVVYNPPYIKLSFKDAKTKKDYLLQSEPIVINGKSHLKRHCNVKTPTKRTSHGSIVENISYVMQWIMNQASSNNNI